jgi:hypothetical protein
VRGKSSKGRVWFDVWGGSGWRLEFEVWSLRFDVVSSYYFKPQTSNSGVIVSPSHSALDTFGFALHIFTLKRLTSDLQSQVEVKSWLCIAVTNCILDEKLDSECTSFSLCGRYRSCLRKVCSPVFQEFISHSNINSIIRPDISLWWAEPVQSPFTSTTKSTTTSATASAGKANYLEV